MEKTYQVIADYHDPRLPGYYGPREHLSRACDRAAVFGSEHWAEARKVAIVRWPDGVVVSVREFRPLPYTSFQRINLAPISV